MNIIKYWWIYNKTKLMNRESCSFIFACIFFFYVTITLFVLITDEMIKDYIKNKKEFWKEYKSKE